MTACLGTTRNLFHSPLITSKGKSRSSPLATPGDGAYNILKEKTRDRKKFPLVFEELCNYGFRRNLWGMRPLGIATSAIATTAVIALIGVDLFVKKASIPPFVIICGVINLFCLLIWLFWFTPNWVKIAAEAYADRLLPTCDNS